jgi:hypothetical protein
MVYRWKACTSLIGAGDVATDVGNEFEIIEKENGKLTPELVVETAKEEDNILHKYFEWDDEIAGDKFRRMQARMLIRSVEVITEDTKEILPAYVNIKNKDTGENIYKNIVSVINNEEDYNYSLNRARIEFLAYKEKYQKILKIKDLKDLILENLGDLK